jgi:hypothetical protein
MVFIGYELLGGRVMKQSTGRVRLCILSGLVLALAACNSTDATLGVAPTDAANKASASAVKLSTSAEAAKASARLYVAPIIGSTVAAVTPLSRRLAALAPTNGLAIVADGDPGKTYVVKGYFSALPENGATTIVFVWDVFDPSGVRQHRIQGQETAAGTAADPWSIVPPTLMEKIADRTIAEFKAWQSGAAAPVIASPVVPPVKPIVAAAPAVAAPPATPDVPAPDVAAPDATKPVTPALIPTVPAPPPSINGQP